MWILQNLTPIYLGYNSWSIYTILSFKMWNFWEHSIWFKHQLYIRGAASTNLAFSYFLIDLIKTIINLLNQLLNNERNTDHLKLLFRHLSQYNLHKFKMTFLVDLIQRVPRRGTRFWLCFNGLFLNTLFWNLIYFLITLSKMLCINFNRLVFENIMAVTHSHTKILHLYAFYSWRLESN